MYKARLGCCFKRMIHVFWLKS
ncbi:hypothetical protein F383_21565 [Gossypium arboreum]|uniref:Uncharacterized protein n=1 Tax=Gossypium arboreum TaxID=29729 RepID=A0A0B0NW67_GOSAR|nr:hypothetical protein F383_21565 [Gossypium arboreum]